MSQEQDWEIPVDHTYYRVDYTGPFIVIALSALALVKLLIWCYEYEHPSEKTSVQTGQHSRAQGTMLNSGSELALASQDLERIGSELKRREIAITALAKQRDQARQNGDPNAESLHETVRMEFDRYSRDFETQYLPAKQRVLDLSRLSQ